MTLRTYLVRRFSFSPLLPLNLWKFSADFFGGSIKKFNFGIYRQATPSFEINNALMTSECHWNVQQPYNLDFVAFSFMHGPGAGVHLAIYTHNPVENVVHKHFPALHNSIVSFLHLSWTKRLHLVISWDRLDIPRLTVKGILTFKCTEGAGVGDYSCWGWGEREIEGL